MNKKIKIGSDFSGVGAFNQALNRLGIRYEEIFACDMDKYARKTFIANYGEPKYYPENVYDREIPSESLDIYMTSPPCFTGDTLIYTDMGFKQIMDIEIGDNVLTHNNSFNKVVDFGSKVSEIWTVKAQGIIETKTTQNHRYYVRKRYRKWNNDRRCDERHFTSPEWVEVKDLTKDHFIGINIPLINENPYKITYDQAYILGRYVADGWIRDRSNESGKTKGNCVVLAIGKDKANSISDKIKLHHTLDKAVNGVHKLFIYSNSLVSLIQALGLGRGAANKRIPPSIINLPKDVLQCFFDGYMDGDGHQNKTYWRATSVSCELLMGLQLVVSKIFRTNANIKFVKTPDTTMIQGRKVNQKDYYILEFRKEMRKQSNAVVIDDIIWYPIRGIEKTGETDIVFDITVEEDHSFTANQAIVHNCQAFSLAGKRKGEDDDRGILFYNSHEFIKKNKPRFFIFENVKGLISDSNGTTFQRWIAYLGGKSVNGNPVLFHMEESVPYHVYWQVLNAKDYGIPQNRERVFIVGIRDDEDNYFSFPKEQHLTKRLKDVLEDNVDEKYYLSDKMINFFIKHTEKHKAKGNGFKFKPKEEESIAQAVTTKAGTRPDDNYIQVKSATSKGFEIAEIGEDSINLEHPNSETRRGRVGNKVAQTLTTSCNQGVAINTKWVRGGLQQNQPFQTNGISPCLTSAMGMGGGQIPIHNYDYRIRKLTPTEVFRLMDYHDSLVENARKVGISDSQLYRQAGNSICVGVLVEIIKQLKYLIK